MNRRMGFTLVEMLLVVSIIVVLIAMLLPSLQAAREAAKRTLCATNLGQCGTALVNYGLDNSAFLPSPPDASTQAHLIRRTQSNYDLRTLMKKYVGGFGIWTCPGVEAPLIDNPANTRNPSYSPYRLYAGRESPDFGTVEPAPSRINSKYAAGRHALMQDVTALLVAQRPWVPIPGGGQPSGAIYNHGRGQLLTFTSDNPSWRFRYGDTIDAVEGANILFFDNAVTWVSGPNLQIVGPWNSSDTGLDLSLKP